MELIIQFVQDQPWYGVAAAAVVLASSITALTPTPAEGTLLSKVYKIIDVLALNIGKAKDKAAVKEAAKK